MIDWLEDARQSISSQRIVAVSFGLYAVDLALDYGSIKSESGWRLLNEENVVIDELTSIEQRSHCELWKLVGTEVARVDAKYNDDLATLELLFSNGLKMEILADSDGYEDWSITTPNGLIICNGRV